MKRMIATVVNVVLINALAMLSVPLNLHAQDTYLLEPDQQIEREISGGQAHTYQLKLEAGQFMRVVVEQNGIDLAMALITPDGKQIIDVDQPFGQFGPESLSHESSISGLYQIIGH